MKRKITLISAISVFLVALAFSSFPRIIGKKNNSQNTCANSITCIDNLSAETESDAQAIFLGNTIIAPPIDLALDTDLYITNSRILGENTEEKNDSQEKHIYIDLSEQKLYTFEGSKKIFETFVSTGKWGRTPVGEYKIWIKIRSTKMSGGSGNDYYYLPNVPYVMYFYSSAVPKSRGYGLHGAYWHNNFGHEMSHGCINLREIDAKIIYDWASPTSIKPTTYSSIEDPGTAISICNSLEIQEGATPLCLD